MTLTALVMRHVRLWARADGRRAAMVLPLGRREVLIRLRLGRDPVPIELRVGLDMLEVEILGQLTAAGRDLERRTRHSTPKRRPVHSPADLRPIRRAVP